MPRKPATLTLCLTQETRTKMSAPARSRTVKDAGGLFCTIRKLIRKLENCGTVCFEPELLVGRPTNYVNQFECAMQFRARRTRIPLLVCIWFANAHIGFAGFPYSMHYQ